MTTLIRMTIPYNFIYVPNESVATSNKNGVDLSSLTEEPLFW